MSKNLVGISCLTLLLAVNAIAQDANLTRSEVSAIRAKLVAVQAAMGADPAGYIKESEEFDLPTGFSPATNGRFWPVYSGVSLRYTDRGTVESAANVEQAAADFQARYSAALASGNVELIAQMAQEMSQLQMQAAAAATSPAARRNPMDVYVQFNSGPSATIDPEAVVLEQEGVIALRETELNDDSGSVTVFIDPVALADSEELSQIDLSTPVDGVDSKTGVYNVVIQANGTVADIEAWIQSFDFAALLAVIDAQ